MSDTVRKATPCTLASKRISRERCQDPDRCVGARTLSPNHVSGIGKVQRLHQNTLPGAFSSRYGTSLALAQAPVWRLAYPILSRSPRLSAYWGLPLFQLPFTFFVLGVSAPLDNGVSLCGGRGRRYHRSDWVVNFPLPRASEGEGLTCINEVNKNGLSCMQ